MTTIATAVLRGGSSGGMPPKSHNFFPLSGCVWKNPVAEIGGNVNCPKVPSWIRPWLFLPNYNFMLHAARNGYCSLRSSYELYTLSLPTQPPHPRTSPHPNPLRVPVCLYAQLSRQTDIVLGITLLIAFPETQLAGSS